jgi:hypothetical protein
LRPERLNSGAAEPTGSPPRLVEGGAVLRWRYGPARGKVFLQRLQPHQQPPVLAQQVDQEPPLSGQESEHNHPAEEAQQLGRREGPEPGYRAGPGSAVVALPEDEARHGRKDCVAREGLPPGRSGVELSKAVAVGLASAGQVDGDAHDEQREERQCHQSPPPGRCGGKEGSGDSQFSQG